MPGATRSIKSISTEKKLETLIQHIFFSFFDFVILNFSCQDVEAEASRLSVFRQLLGKIGSPSDSRQLRDELSQSQSAFVQSVRVAKNKLQPQIKR